MSVADPITPVKGTGAAMARDVAPRPSRASAWKAALLDRASLIIPCVMLAALLGLYASLRDGVFTIDELNLDTAAAMTLLLAATGQTIVLLRGGIDLSIGGMISLGTVLAATRFGTDPAQATAWALGIVVLGALVGALNGVLITALRLQPFLVTLATWSILSGTAMIILPTDGGSLPTGWTMFGVTSWLGLSTSVWLLALLLVFWFWFKRTRLGIAIRATGSNERSAFLAGASISPPMASPASSPRWRRSTSLPRPAPARPPSAKTTSCRRWRPR